MCGFAGLIRFDGADADPRLVDAMASRLAHRGPDGSGARARGRAAIAHRRLAIVDPSGGAQPLSSEDGEIAVVANGEIYNAPELQRELERDGHRFATGSDNEAIVHAYERWGDACVERLRGMFAFALVDWRRGRVLLARDAFGIKPLWYRVDGASLAFASEAQALRADPAWRRAVDPTAIDHYLACNYVPSPRSAFAALAKLPPGSLATADFSGGLRVERWWRPDFAPEPARSPREWAAELETVLRESVRAHLRSDVPVGAFLSGGVDSAAVAAQIVALGAPVRAYTIGFADADFDESAAAAETARLLEIEHRVEVAALDPLAALPELVRHHGEPFADSSSLPTWLLARHAARDVKVVLSGDGGDELFAGYDAYRAWLRWLADEGVGAARRLARRAISATLPDRYPPKRATASTWWRFIATRPPAARRRLWRPELRPRPEPPPMAIERAAAAAGDPVTLAQELDLRAYLPDDVLTKVDVASMRHALEVRTPLLDRCVFEVARRIPRALQLPGPPTAALGKAVLRGALEAHLPRAHLERPKHGFAAPLARWLQPHRAAIAERLTASDSPLRDWLRPSAVAAELAGGRAELAWSLLVLDEWLRQANAT